MSNSKRPGRVVTIALVVFWSLATVVTAVLWQVVTC